MKIRKTFVTLAAAFVVLLALSLPAFSQDCDPYPTRQRLASPDSGFSGAVYNRIGSAIDYNSPRQGDTVYAIDQDTGETFYSVTDEDGVFGRSGTGGLEIVYIGGAPASAGYYNDGVWDWYRQSDNEHMKNGLPLCKYYSIVIDTFTFNPNPHTTSPNRQGNLFILAFGATDQ